jgi:2,3-bisphosphoglycerate-dependent phosphoglycerate mutase
MRILLIAIVVLFSLFSTPAIFSQDDAVTTILLVRHAEKSAAPADDPALTEIGKARAQSLIKMLGQSGIKAIYATQFTRTKETARPLAEHLGLTVTQIDASDTKKLVEQIRSQHAGKTVLIAGHSNTLPKIIEELGGDVIPSIAESEYDNLFVVTLNRSGKAKVLRIKYGN